MLGNEQPYQLRHIVWEAPQQRHRQAPNAYLALVIDRTRVRSQIHANY